jgi:MarR family transcriptional regulator, organic hydroperoxide resistance regulator
MGPLLHNQACYALYSTSSVVTKAYSTLLKPLQLTYPQFVVMMALWQKDHVSVTELAKIVGISKSTMTPLLRRLERLDYVTKNLEPGDDRQKCITLTALGQSHANEASKIAKQALCATGLNNEEAKQLIALCSKIKLNLS